MDKHTFQVGDRVIYTDSSLKTHVGAKGQYWEGTHDGGTLTLPGVKFDNDNLNRLVYNREFFSVWSRDSLKHDTDFQVGDWVRYVAADNLALRKDGITGKITDIREIDCITVDWGDGGRGNHSRKYLTKIQPPQEESDDTIIHVFTSYTNKEEKKMRNVFNITHEKYGVVQGVYQVAPGCYCKNGAHYYHGEGWREAEEWVKIEVNKCDEHRLKYAVDYTDGEMIKWRYQR